MATNSAASLDRAGDFIWRNARLIERAQFAHLFVAAAPGRVVAALSAYRNPDGGFGNALEADVRAPGSTPLACEAALIILWQSGICERSIASAVCEYLTSVAEPGGRVPIVTKEILDYPRASHWDSPSFGGDSPNPTAGLVGMLAYQGIEHRWLSKAADWCWKRLQSPLHDVHESASALRFLECVPDRPGARELAIKLARAAEKTNWFQLHPDPSAYGLTPLHLCPRPDSIAAGAFAEELLNEHFDHLAALQEADGGWPITWEAPGPGAELEWRGRVTVDALITLRAYGRI